LTWGRAVRGVVADGATNARIGRNGLVERDRTRVCCFAPGAPVGARHPSRGCQSFQAGFGAFYAGLNAYATRSIRPVSRA
jgi:hypothetical protein